MFFVAAPADPETSFAAMAYPHKSPAAVASKMSIAAHLADRDRLMMVVFLVPQPDLFMHARSAVVIPDMLAAFRAHPIPGFVDLAPTIGAHAFRAPALEETAHIFVCPLFSFAALLSLPVPFPAAPALYAFAITLASTLGTKPTFKPGIVAPHPFMCPALVVLLFALEATCLAIPLPPVLSLTKTLRATAAH